MSDYEKSNNTKDSFSEYFRKRLINKLTPPDDKCWDEIDARLPKRRATNWGWLGLAIAASVITAALIFNYWATKHDHPVLDDSLASQENIVDKKILEDRNSTNEEGDVISPEKTHESLIAVAIPSIEKETPVTSSVGSNPLGEILVSSSADSVEADKNMALIDTEKTIQDTSGYKTPESNEITENGYNDDTSIQKDMLHSGSLENRVVFDISQKNRSGNSKKWLMMSGLATSSGGIGYLLSSLNTSRTDADFSSLPVGDSNAPPLLDPDGNGNTENIPIEEITDVNTSVPVSFGITARKKINETIGIETGLLYTYLSSEFKIRGTEYSSGTLKLHYIGIPVNLIVNVWGKKLWSIYISGGGMVEKGLQSVYLKRGYNINNSKEKNNIPGFQWSLNGSVGLSYNFYKYMSLYVEPSVSYYFDCNQPISKRTEVPFLFNLRTGIRYDF